MLRFLFNGWNDFNEISVNETKLSQLIWSYTFSSSLNAIDSILKECKMEKLILKNLWWKSVFLFTFLGVEKVFTLQRWRNNKSLLSNRQVYEYHQYSQCYCKILFRLFSVYGVIGKIEKKWATVYTTNVYTHFHCKSLVFFYVSYCLTCVADSLVRLQIICCTLFEMIRHQ